MQAAVISGKIPNLIFLDGGPRDYLSLIDNAKVVFTDSFHTVMFSLNFGKSFYVFPRQYSHSFSQSSRILDLLKRYGHVDRYIQTETDFLKTAQPIDSSCLLTDRENTINYLRNAISEVH